MERKKLSENECLKHGGHYWNLHHANTCVDEFGKPTSMQHLVYYPGGEPFFRTCSLCGKKQEQIIKWVDI